MLLQKLHRDESIEIGPDIRVMVVAVNRWSVTLGIEAPHDLAVSRSSACSKNSVGKNNLPVGVILDE